MGPFVKKWSKQHMDRSMDDAFYKAPQHCRAIGSFSTMAKRKGGRGEKYQEVNAISSLAIDAKLFVNRFLLPRQILQFLFEVQKFNTFHLQKGLAEIFPFCKMVKLLGRNKKKHLVWQHQFVLVSSKSFCSALLKVALLSLPGRIEADIYYSVAHHIPRYPKLYCYLTFFASRSVVLLRNIESTRLVVKATETAKLQRNCLGTCCWQPFF